MAAAKLQLGCDILTKKKKREKRRNLKTFFQIETVGTTSLQALEHSCKSRYFS